MLSVAAVSGLLLAAASPTGAHGLSNASAAMSDTLKVSLAAPDGGTVAEGATGHFEVSVAGSTAAGAVTVRYSVSGTAVAGEDYTALSGEVTVAQGENVARIALEALEDGVLDKGETVVLALSGATGPGTLLVDQTAATATIADNGSVTVSLTAVPDTIAEGSAWRSAVTMSTPVADRVSVRWWTTDGTALAGRDYTAADEVVSFRPGETSKSIQVQTLRDANTEPVEVFYVSLGLPADAVGGSGLNFGDAQSAFIQCSVEFPPPFPKYFEPNEPVAAGTVIGTVAANTTDGIPYYELDDGGENKFAINSLTAEIRTTAPLAAGGFYELEVTVHDECGAEASVDVNVKVNSKPKVMPPISNKSVTLGESGSVDASKHFSDPDRNKLTYTATSSKPSVASVSVDGSTVTYAGKTVGSATVSVTATDPGGLSATDDFDVEVVKDEPPKFDPPSYSARLLDTAKPRATVVMVVAKDPEGKAVKYSLSGLGSDQFAIDEDSGEITVAGTLSVTIYKLTAEATDPAGNKGTAPVTVDVEPDDPPVFEPPSYSVSIKVNASSVVTVSATDPEGEAVEYSLSGSDKFAIDKDSGEITVAGTLSVTTYELTAEATDPADNKGTAPVEVRVLNDPPDVTATASPNPAEEGETVSLTGTADDPEGHAMTYLWTQVSGSPTVAINNATKLTANFEAPGVVSDTDLTFQLKATDALGAADSASVTVTVEPTPNNPPDTVGSIPNATLEVGQSKSVVVSSYFSDPDKDPLKYKVESSDPTVVAVSVNGSKVTYTGEAVGSATVTVTADDDRGGTAEQKFLVTVEPANRPPNRVGTIPDQRVELNTSGRVDVADYFSDPDNDPLTYEASTVASAVARVWVDGSTVRLRGLRVGDATVKVTARDDGGLTATQEFGVEVHEQPAQECAITRVAAGTFTVGEHATTVGTVGVDASDCGTLDYALSGAGADDVSAAAVNASNDNAAITGSFNFEVKSSYDLTLTVSERGGSASKSGRLRISVTDENDAPRASGTISKQRVQVGEPISVNVTGYFTDEDAGDRLTFTSESSATGRLTVNAKGSPVTLTGVAAGSATVTVTARDRGNLTATQTFSVTVVPKTTTECRISVSKGALSVPEDAGKGDGVDGKVGVTASGACGTLSYALSGTGSGNFTVAAAGSSDDDAKLKVAGTLDHETTASYALKLTVSSGTVSAEGDVGVTVTDVNEAPVIDSTIPAQGVVTGKSKSVAMSSHFSDPDGDDLTYLASSSNRNVATVSVNSGTVVVRGVAKGGAEVTVTARDPSGLEAKQAFSVTVTDPPPTNGAPKIESAIPAREVVAGESVTVVVSSHFSDPDNDALTYLAESLNETVATVSVNGDKVVVQGVAKGSVEVKVTARDPHAEEISQRFSVTVKPANAAPVAATAIPAMTVAAGESKTVDVSAHFRDPDGDALEYEASSSNEAAATVGVEGSELKVTGVLRGESRVTVTARDPDGAKASQSFLVTVPNEAPEPVGTIPALTLSKGDTGSVRVSAHFSDAESDALTYKATSSNAGVLSVKVAGEHVSYEALKAGTSRVTVTADDGHGGTVDQEFGVTVKPENAAPVIVSAMAAITVEADSMEVVDAAPHFRDPDGDALSYEASSSNEAVAKAAVSGSEVTVTGVSRGDARVTVTALDGRGGSVPQGFAVTVPNRAPEAVGSIGPVTAYMHDRVKVPMSDAFRDPDGDKLSYRASSSNEGVVTVEMIGNEVGIRGVSRSSARVTVTADDGYGGTVEQ